MHDHLKKLNADENLTRLWDIRSTLKKLVRNFFEERGYLECDTPTLVMTPGTEVHLGFFETQWLDHRKVPHRLFLRTSPEIHLKKTLAQGPEKIYQLDRAFRNEGEISAWHHPEFTMLEWYERGISFAAFMTQTEDLLRSTEAAMVKRFGLKPVLPPKIERLSVAEAFERFAKIKLVDGDRRLAKTAKDAGIISVSDGDDFATAFFKILLDRVEPGLSGMGAVFLYDYPASQAALAQVTGGVAKRFELYLRGVELCNAFQELTDAEESRRRYQEAQEERRHLGKVRAPFDEEFYQALKTGIPDCCGNALGFDRWLALLMGDQNLDRAIPFRFTPPFDPRVD